MEFYQFYAQYGCGDNKTKEWEVYVVVNERFELFFGTVGEEDVW